MSFGEFKKTNLAEIFVCFAWDRLDLKLTRGVNGSLFNRLASFYCTTAIIFLWSVTSSEWAFPFFPRIFNFQLLYCHSKRLLFSYTANVIVLIPTTFCRVSFPDVIQAYYIKTLSRLPLNVVDWTTYCCFGYKHLMLTSYCS